jgi:transcriptional regulator with XRE-family HTH domain
VDISMTVRSARRALGLSQRDFAARIGVSGKTVASWESGGRVPTVGALRQVLALQGLELTARRPDGEPAPELIRHLQLSLTSRLRLALGESPNPYHRATGDAWQALLVLGRLGRAVVQPPVATGIWIPVAPSRSVRVVVHAPRGELPVLSGADVASTADPSPPSLVPVTVEGPVRVWVLPPGELLADDAEQLELASALLYASDSRDDAVRRAPAHRDPHEWVEAARMLMTKGTEGLERPKPELGRAWRLGAPVSSAQAVRRETWRRAQRGGPAAP